MISRASLTPGLKLSSRRLKGAVQRIGTPLGRNPSPLSTRWFSTPSRSMKAALITCLGRSTVTSNEAETNRKRLIRQSSFGLCYTFSAPIHEGQTSQIPLGRQESRWTREGDCQKFQKQKRLELEWRIIFGQRRWPYPPTVAGFYGQWLIVLRVLYARPPSNFPPFLDPLAMGGFSYLGEVSASLFFQIASIVRF